MDRNEQARQQEHLKRINLQHRQNFDRFRGDLELGKIGMTDRFGNRVVVGDHILWRPPATHDFIYRVKDVIPVLDPTKPVGVVRLMLVAEIPVEYIAGAPSLSVIKVGVPADAPQDAERSTGLPPADAPKPAEGDGTIVGADGQRYGTQAGQLALVKDDQGTPPEGQHEDAPAEGNTDGNG